MNTQLLFLQNPFGDSPQGKLLTQMQGMIAEYERAQIAERTRRGRLEKARQGEFIPWAYSCYGYRYLPQKARLCATGTIDLEEAEVVRAMYRALVEEQLSCRQITKRLNASQTPTPREEYRLAPGNREKHSDQSRLCRASPYNYRQPTMPKYRKTEEHQLRSLRRGEATERPANGS